MNAEYTNQIVQFKDKNETKAMKFLQAAVSKDAARPILNTVYVKNGRTEAADGFRAHIINTPDALAEHEGKNLHPDTTISVTPRPEPFCEYPGQFPDLEFLNKEYAENEIVFQIAVNKNYLKDLINMPADDNMLIFSFTGENRPMRVTTHNQDFEPVAYIMPMHLKK